MRRSRIICWLAAIGVGAGIGAGVWAAWFWRPVGSGPAGPRVDATPFHEVWSERPVVLLGLGDSVTAGFGASPGHSYFERLVAAPRSDDLDVRDLGLRRVFPNLTVTNLALSGSTLGQALKAQVPRIGRYPSNVLGVVVVTIGGNDLIHNYGRSAPMDGAMFGASWNQAQPWLHEFEQRIERLLSAIEAAFPGGCRIFIGNIYDPSDGTGSLRTVGLPAWPDGGRIHERCNEILDRVVARRTQVRRVDIHSEFLGHGVTCTQFWRSTFRREDPHWWYHANVEDPNDRGYDALRRLFLNAMADRFVRPAPPSP